MNSLSTSPSERVYKASFATYRNYLKGALAAGSFFVVLLLLNVRHKSGATVAIVILLVGMAIGLGYVFVYIKRARFIITDTEVRYRGLLKTTTIPRSGLRSILVNYGSSNPPLVMLMLADATYSKKFRLNGGLWDNADQKEILDLLKGEDLLSQSVITARELYKTHPQFVRGLERGFGLSPAASVAMIVISTLVVISAIIFVGVMLNSR